MNNINPSWLRDYYKGWSDERLQEHYLDISTFERKKHEIFMLKMEMDRRKQLNGNKTSEI